VKNDVVEARRDLPCLADPRRRCPLTPHITDTKDARWGENRLSLKVICYREFRELGTNVRFPFTPQPVVNIPDARRPIGSRRSVTAAAKGHRRGDGAGQVAVGQDPADRLGPRPSGGRDMDEQAVLAATINRVGVGGGSCKTPVSRRPTPGVAGLVRRYRGPVGEWGKQNQVSSGEKAAQLSFRRTKPRR